MFAVESLKPFVECLAEVPDPRSKQGVSHPFPTVIAIVFLGLIANRSTLAEIERWAKIHIDQLQQFLPFKKGVPHAITLARILRKLSIGDLQKAFARFVNIVLQSQTLVAAVDGKAAKQMTDKNDQPLLMLNVFAQRLKVHLASWSVKGDKTNEPSCLKNHLAELFTMYPCLQLLTGDAAFATRPLLEAIQEYNRDYLVKVKENQPKALEHLKLSFKDAEHQKPSAELNSKKRGLLRFVVCG